MLDLWRTPEERLLTIRDTADIEPTNVQASHFLRSTYHHALGMERSLQHIESKQPELERQYTQFNWTPDTQRPHDMEGPHHKLTWYVFKGLALFPEIHRNDLPNAIKIVIDNSLKAHREQGHHSGLRTQPIGALDALHSKLERRGYQGGAITLDKLEDFIDNEMYHDMRPAARAVLPSLQEIGYVDLNGYRTIDSTPNPGLPEHLFQDIRARTHAFRDKLKNMGYIITV